MCIYTYIFQVVYNILIQGSRQFIRNVWTKRVGFSRHSLEFSCLKERITIYLSQKQKRILKVMFLVYLSVHIFLFTDRPEIITHPKNVTPEEGLLMTLFCNATGNPPPTLSWTKDGSPLTNTQGIILSGDNETLYIAKVNRSESGNYRCVARNSLGDDTSNTAKVDVQCK